MVVICLKNRTFAVSQTTLLMQEIALLGLWFAWKIVLLQYRKQPTPKDMKDLISCDLLEKSYFCSIANNRCSANVTGRPLWFAWKIVLLQYRKQHGHLRLYHFVCCDLLEKSYFCSIANNVLFINHIAKIVVICLKNRTFAVSQTTNLPNLPLYKGLWFAWKIVLLQYRKQRCKLLGIRQIVVICLKNRTFAVSQTTRP